MKRIFALSIILVMSNIFFLVQVAAAPNDDLVKAVVRDDPAGAGIALQKGADINFRDKDGVTPLMKAANLGKTRAAKFLVEKGADINIRSNTKHTALTIAQARGYKEITAILKSKVSVINSGNTSPVNQAFIAAVAQGDADKVQKTLAGGADINIKDKDGNSMLYHAIKGENILIAKMLIEKGIDLKNINEKDKNGKTLLNHCAMTLKDFDEISNILIARGADRKGFVPRAEVDRVIAKLKGAILNYAANSDKWPKLVENMDKMEEKLLAAQEENDKALEISAEIQSKSEDVSESELERMNEEIENDKKRMAVHTDKVAEYSKEIDELILAQREILRSIIITYCHENSINMDIFSDAAFRDICMVILEKL